VFGSYRIDQEVTQLVRGWPHSIEVLASRAVDDRRAVETSLLKALHAAETDEDGRRRVRTACEDYGLVARQNAMLLLSSDAYERTAAARTLAEMRSAQALPFLTEALYDADAVVRTEAVKALGALGLPSSIGAMLDVARRHPEMPAAILGPALTACSVETVEAGEGLQEEGVTLARAASAEQFVSEMRGVEPVSVRQLPEWLEDATLQESLERLGSADVEARIVAAQSLARFQVRRAVEALAAMAVRDEAAAVRAAAVTALGSIDHETVFASVLIAMADDSREVRAAAARTMSRLGFERADAYMHVTETADRQTLCEAARACVGSGLAAQAVGRLTSEDRRQAYEAFSVLALVVKGGEAQVILDAVAAHRDTEVRLAAVHVLGLMDDPDLAEQLEMIARRGGLPAPVHAAISEVAGRVARARQEVFES
ncbi:MAG TPA: HEAT repeat domain-containing protein, partial [Pyrinomonadaceae bacterium]|nr:HEAT repeat domain-containing protein [Pyrinomonadaceae bacterium]